MKARSFGVDLGGSTLADVRRQVLSDFTPMERCRLAEDGNFVVTPDLKVSCKYGDACTSASRRDQTESKAWMCGSSCSHNDRLKGCVCYLLFERFLESGQCGNRRFPK